MQVNRSRFEGYSRQLKIEKNSGPSKASPLNSRNSQERILKRDYIFLEGTDAEMNQQLDKLRINISRGRHPVGHFVDIRV